MTRSLGRFIGLVGAFGNGIDDLFFVSNKDFDAVRPGSGDERRRGRSPVLFLKPMRGCAAAHAIAPPFKAAFDDLQATCGCGPDRLFDVLLRLNLVTGPSCGDFDAALAHEHLGSLPECRGLSPGDLDAFRDELVARVHRAPSLQVTDPVRHLRSLVNAEGEEPRSWQSGPRSSS